MVKHKTVGKTTRKKIQNKSTKKRKFRAVYRDYMDGKIRLDWHQKIGIFCLVVVISGFAGWVWEFLLQEISEGFREIYIKGGNLLPWINIYAYGAVLTIVLTYKLRKKPALVFVVAAIATGLLEWFAGWAVYTFGDGTRYWNYTGKWWAIGNIDGFVCPASAIAFGLGALVLIYVLLPFCIKLALEMKKKVFSTLSITLLVVVLVDDITNLTLKNLGLPTAMNLYEDLGFKLLHK